MLNPDGVVFGNYRCSFLGQDMNRMFYQEGSVAIDERLAPEITAMKQLFDFCSQQGSLFSFFDLHQHSKKKGAFIYGPSYPI